MCQNGRKTEGTQINITVTRKQNRNSFTIGHFCGRKLRMIYLQRMKVRKYWIRHYFLVCLQVECMSCKIKWQAIFAWIYDAESSEEKCSSLLGCSPQRKTRKSRTVLNKCKACTYLLSLCKSTVSLSWRCTRTIIFLSVLENKIRSFLYKESSIQD